MDQERAASALGVRAAVREGAEPREDWQGDADAWTVTLRYQGRRLTVPFFKGIGHHGAEPTADEVLECLLLDASGFENARDFEDFCAEYGYDTDSRTAERVYRDVERQTAGLKRLLGADFERALWGEQ
jgi:hypothetical protein